MKPRSRWNYANNALLETLNDQRFEQSFVVLNIERLPLHCIHVRSMNVNVYRLRSILFIINRPRADREATGRSRFPVVSQLGIHVLNENSIYSQYHKRPGLWERSSMSWTKTRKYLCCTKHQLGSLSTVSLTVRSQIPPSDDVNKSCTQFNTRPNNLRSCVVSINFILSVPLGVHADYTFRRS